MRLVASGWLVVGPHYQLVVVACRWQMGQDGSAVTQQAGIAQEKLVVIFKTVNVLNRTRAVSS